MTTVSSSTVSSDLLNAMNTTSSSSSSGTSVDDIQERFMTLLVAQMKNQDPLNPLDNAQVTSQLAQLSTVTGISELNSTVQNLLGNYQASQSLQAANMLGHGVLIDGSQLQLSSGVGVYGIELADAADAVQVTIRDASGNAVWSGDLGASEAGSLALTWDGSTTSGGTAADGQYKVEVKATRGGASVGATALTLGVVTSVVSSTSGVQLNLGSLGTVAVGDVRQIL